MKSDNSYFILSSSCKIVNGANRAIIIDYNRRNVYYIPNEYYDLIEMMDRKMVSYVESLMDDRDSLENLQNFLTFLIENEIGIIVDNPELFPKISDKIEPEPRIIKNAIIEVDEELFREALFIKICNELRELFCIDIQIRLYSNLNLQFLSKLIDIITDNDFRYLEVLCIYDDNLDINTLHSFMENTPLLSTLIMYQAPENNKIDVVIETAPSTSISLGQIFLLKEVFEPEKSCGIINIQTLDFSHIHNFNRLKEQNGCLYKKIAIDRKGNIKNCPSFNFDYGNINNKSINEIVKLTEFTKYWYLSKNLIDTCKFCEYRYNCTDCRVFICNKDNIHSKPIKCSYNLQTGSWD